MPSPTFSAQTDPLVGTVIASKYEIVRLLGQGGMAKVYEARNIALHKPVALKFISEAVLSQDGADRFLREARIASAIRSDYVVEVFDVGQSERGVPYIVMELLQGQTLGHLLRTSGPLPIPKALTLIRQVLLGLHDAHEQGVIHRDLKPENVFVTDGEKLRVKLLDFGISKRFGLPRDEDESGNDDIVPTLESASLRDMMADLTEHGDILGTPAYMSPEQARGYRDLDARSDLWSVGVLLYQMLTGRHPFPGSSHRQIVVNLLTKSPSPFPAERNVPLQLQAIILRALVKQPASRFSSAMEMLDAIEHLQRAPNKSPNSENQVETTPGVDISDSTRSRFTDQWYLGGIGVISALLGAATFMSWLGLSSAHAIEVSSVDTPSPSQSAPTTMISNEALLNVETEPSNARISIDGRRVTVWPWKARAGSSCRLRIEADGFVPEHRNVRLRAGPQTLVIHLARQPRADASSPKPNKPRRPLPSVRSSALPRSSGTGITGGLQLKTKLQ